VTIDVDDAKELLCDGAHEEQLTALLILVNKFQRTDEAQRRVIVDLYLASTEHGQLGPGGLLRGPLITGRA
jgi:hypothetical protein